MHKEARDRGKLAYIHAERLVIDGVELSSIYNVIT